MPATIQWPVSSSPPPLSENEIHLWAACLDVSRDALGKLARLLSEEERERAERFKFDKHRNRFIAGRGFMRRMLGSYLEAEPAKLHFASGPRGKPILPPRFARRIHFNLAHSEDIAVFAVTLAGPVGVDVERIRPVNDVDALVARFFSASEDALFQQVATEQKPAAFFNLWTRKEALLKATGEGITGSLNEVEVSFMPEEPARVLTIRSSLEAAARWTIRDFSPSTGFVGAVAIEAKIGSLQLHAIPL